MGLLLHLFVVTTCLAVVHCAPLEVSNSESTTVGIQPLPALLSKTDDIPKESDESKDDAKRVVRESPTSTTEGNKDSTTEKPFKFESRPPRDVSGIPKPPSSQTTPAPSNEKPQGRPVREAPPPLAAQPAPVPERNPPPPPPPGNGPPPPPPPPGHPPPPPPSAESRPVRDTTRQGPPPNAPQTRPATLPGKIEPIPVPGAAQKGRNIRDVESPTTSTENPENKD